MYMSMVHYSQEPLTESGKKGKGGKSFRILVDRLWPRGLSKDKVRVDLWQKDIAPSNPLRKWFGHDEKKWDEFPRVRSK